MDMYHMSREERRRELCEEAQQGRRILGLPRGRQTKYPRGKAKGEQTHSLRYPFTRGKA